MQTNNSNMRSNLSLRNLHCSAIDPLETSSFHNNNSNDFSRNRVIDAETAIRLYNSIHRSNTILELQDNHNLLMNGMSGINQYHNRSETENITIYNSLERSVISFNSIVSEGNTCRICRQKETDTELINDTCKCTGTIGYIHLKCLHRWIRYRQKMICEICNTKFTVPQEQRNYKQLMKKFFSKQYIGICFSNILNLIFFTPLIYFSLNQIIYTIESKYNNGTMKVLVIGPLMLMGTSLYFFLFFEWAISCLFQIKNVLNHWWNFSDQSDEDSPTIDQEEYDRRLFFLEF